MGDGKVLDKTICPNCKKNQSPKLWMEGTPLEGPDMCEECYSKIDETIDCMYPKE